MRSPLHLLRWLLGALFLGLAGPLFALDTPAVQITAPAAGRVVGGSVTLHGSSDYQNLISRGFTPKVGKTDFERLLEAGFVPGDLNVKDTAKVRVGTKDVDMVLNRTMPWQAVGKAAAAVAKSLPAVATAYAIWEAFDSFRVRPDGGGGLGFDDGTPQVSTPVTLYQGSYQTGSTCASGSLAAGSGSPGVFTSLAAAAQSLATCLALPYSSQSRVYTYTNCEVTGSWSCLFNYTGTFQGSPIGGSAGYQGGAKSQSTTMQCPASIDALNPANSLPAGLPVGPDGKCRTGRYNTPQTEQQAADKWTNWAPKGRLVEIGAELVDNTDLRPYFPSVQTPTLTGPSTVSEPGVTSTETGPSGTTTTTSSPNHVVTYQGDSYSWTDNRIVTTTNNGGSPTTIITNGPGTEPGDSCGLPGMPPCKIDETGTPSVDPVQDPTGPLLQQDSAKRNEVAGSVQAPTFGWISAPALAECTPYEMPNGIPSINPCPAMNGVRSIMAYLWALAAFWICAGMIRRTVAGG